MCAGWQGWLQACLPACCQPWCLELLPLLPCCLAVTEASHQPALCPHLLHARPPAERDEGEFARLSQLGDVLGLTQMDVYQVGGAGGMRALWCMEGA